jgi:hypothetical protein
MVMPTSHTPAGGERHDQLPLEQRFLVLLQFALGAGWAHLAGYEGGMPEPAAEACGWRHRLEDCGDHVEEGWEPEGVRIGWLDGADVYLDPAAAFRVAREGSAEGVLDVSPGTVFRRLHEAGHLVSVDLARTGRLTVRRRLGSSPRQVLHLRASDLGIGAAGEVVDTPDEERGPRRRDEGAYPTLEAALAGEFAGVEPEILQEIARDAALIARWSGLQAVDVVRMLACLEVWELPVRCRICGCTDEQACEGGCAWVPDPAGLGELCSRCSPSAEQELRAAEAQGTDRAPAAASPAEGGSA